MHTITVQHKFLGTVEITPACQALQALNTDPSTIYVEYDHSIRAVSKALMVATVEPTEDNSPP